MRYSRFFDSEELLCRVASDKAFLALKGAAESGMGSISILEGNCIQLNYGTTRLARLKYNKNGLRGELYHPPEIMRSDTSLVDLAARVKKVNPKYQVEGKWQDQLCRDGLFSVASTNQRWLIIDREAVIGFSSQLKKDEFRSVVKGALLIQTEPFHRNHANWPKFKMPGDECDLLALSDAGELGCWEVKDGSNPALEWAPLQASAYQIAFEIAAPSIAEGIKKMVRQKVELGFLSKDALGFLPNEGFTKIDAAVVVGNAKASRQKTARLRESRDAVVPYVRVLELVQGRNELAELDFE